MDFGKRRATDGFAMTSGRKSLSKMIPDENEQIKENVRDIP